MTTSEQINDIAAALSKAQGAMKPAAKDSVNPHFKSKYADLAANVEAARETLAANGLAVVQEAFTKSGFQGDSAAVYVATRILHSSGQWIQFDALGVPMQKQDAHGVGSALTYARRYSLGAALGLVAEDDDGNAAVSAAPQAKALVAPKGFAEWLLDFEATADEGLPALRKMWMDSDEANRTYMKATASKRLEELKAKAAKKGKANAA